MWSAVAERSGDTALDQNRQRLPMPSAYRIQSAVAGPLTRASAGALHSRAHQFAGELPQNPP